MMSRGTKKNPDKRGAAPPPPSKAQQKQLKTQKQKRKERLKRRAEARPAAGATTHALSSRRERKKALSAAWKARTELNVAAESRRIEEAHKKENEDEEMSPQGSNLFELAPDDADEAALCSSRGELAVERSAGGDAPPALSSQHWDLPARSDSAGPGQWTQPLTSKDEDALKSGSPTQNHRDLRDPAQIHGLEEALSATVAHFKEGIERLGSFLTEVAKSPVHMAEAYRAFVLQQGAERFVVGGKEVSKDEVVGQIDALAGRLGRR